MRRAYPDELRADFQQYYQLNIDGMGNDFSLFHASILVAQLPSESRCLVKAEPALRWGQQDHLLAEIANNLRLLVWAQTKDATKGKNRPKMIELPAAGAQSQSKQNALTAKDYKRILSRPRGGDSK